MKLLKGKCLDKFEIWYTIVFCEIERPSYCDGLKREVCDIFWDNRLAEQIGVLELFFDSVGIDIGVNKYRDKDGNTDFIWFVLMEDISIKDFANSREEARKQAIIKADEICNNKS